MAFNKYQILQSDNFKVEVNFEDMEIRLLRFVTAIKRQFQRAQLMALVFLKLA